MTQANLLRQFAHLHYNVGAVHMSKGHYGAAVRCFRESHSWFCPPATTAMLTVAEAAHNAAAASLRAEKIAEAVGFWRAVWAAAPGESSAAALGRLIAVGAYNQGAKAFNQGNFDEAVVLLSFAVELDPELTAARKPLGIALRAVTTAHFENGRAAEGLAAFDRLVALDLVPDASESPLRFGVEAWLRHSFWTQVRDLKVGGAVVLLSSLSRLIPDALQHDVDLVGQIGDLARLLAGLASERSREVLEAVLTLHPLVPSAPLAYAGAAAYKAAITEGQRLHTEDEPLAALDFCLPAVRYRPSDQQLSHTLGILLCRRVQDLLARAEHVESLAIHERILSLLEARRSPGIVTS
jgi:tetratricopeptide (TPR) repeat protein